MQPGSMVDLRQKTGYNEYVLFGIQGAPSGIIGWQKNGTEGKSTKL